MTAGHFTTGELRAFARGETDEGLDALVEHCKICSRCGDQLAVIFAITSPGARRKLAAQPARWERIRVAAALAIVVAVAAIAFALLQRPTLDHAVDASPLPPSISALATTEPPPRMIVKFQLGNAAPASIDDTIMRLQTAGVDVAERRYDAAIEELEVLHRRRPSWGHVTAYLGIALYLSGEDSPRPGELLATASRDRNESIAEFAQWYHANYLLRTGRVQEAASVLEPLATEPTIPGRSARDLLQKIKTLEQQ